ncbi:MAG: hypothetical protein JWP52_3418 [Rhizobacter sp.]|nr:hypothetical protein [Rhizobacter sp.]
MPIEERDGNFEGTIDATASGKARADKNPWKLELSKATDVGPKSPLIGTPIAGGAVTYDSTSGLTVGGKTMEDLAGTLDAPAAVKAAESSALRLCARGASRSEAPFPTPEFRPWSASLAAVPFSRLAPARLRRL